MKIGENFCNKVAEKICMNGGLKMSNTKLDNINKKIEQLKAQKQAVLAREKEKERKARTRRLIQIGAIVEKHLTVDNVHKAEALCEYLTKYPDSFDKLIQYMEKQAPIIQENFSGENK